MSYLKIKKKIGIFSPSLPIGVYFPKRLQRAIDFLTQHGFEIKQGGLTHSKYNYLSGDIKSRAKEFNELLYDDEIDCILATIGGMNTNAILPYIDYEYLKKHPKLIVGYSDVGALLSAIYAKTGIHTVYGPCLLSAFGEIGVLANASLTYFSKLFVEETLFPHYIPKPHAYSDTYVDWNTQTEMLPLFKNEWKTVRSGITSGRCLIFNLGTYAYTYGSEYFPEIKQGDILVLEDTMDNPMQIERAYAHLKLCGVFEKVGGIILGKHANYDHLGMNIYPYDLILLYVEKQIPILAQVDIGHTLPVMSFVNGSNIELDATNQKITVNCL